MRRLAPVLALALLAAGCGPDDRAQPLPARGPANVVRVGLAELRRPLDPALVAGRDEESIARAVFALPLRTAADSGALRPGLCTSWATPDRGRTWRFRCAHPSAVAATLERMRTLPDTPSGWLFAPIEEVRRAGSAVTVRLRFRWARFPYVLTTVAAAPRGVPGPFRVVAAAPARIELRRGALTLRFTRVNPLRAVSGFRSGTLDEAPVPPGDLRRLELDAQLGPAVRTRRLLGLDLVELDLRTGALAALPHTRRVYWRTASRGDYSELVPEGAAPPVFGIARSARPPTTSEIRQARAAASSLPPVAVPIAVPAGLLVAAETLVADWRDLGLGPLVAKRPAAARFERLVAAYPRREALAAALLLPQDDRNPWVAGPSRARTLLLRSLASGDERSLARVDAALRSAAAIVPVAGVVGARLVSPRLLGWHQDARGVVDYSAVRFREPSRRR
jgi:hypothetical protein